MKSVGVEELHLQAFLTFTLNGNECAVSGTCRFTPGLVAPGNRCLGSRVGPIGFL